jgi:hypothetical protein
MAYPSDLTRTKNWGTEILTDSDLEGQLDLIINWVMASLNSSTGHTHSGSGNNGPKLSIASAMTIASQATGDLIYASSTSAWARLAKGTALQQLRMNSGATAPEWATITQTPITSSSEVTAASTTTTTSTSYTDLNSMSITFTPASASNKILILFTCETAHETGGVANTFVIDISGAVSGTERKAHAPNNDGYTSVAIAHLTTLAASSQTVKVQWKTGSGTATTDDRKLIVMEFRVV